MTHEICDACETVAHCMKSGCIPLQPQALKPCRSPYCECTPGICSHPGCYDARSEEFTPPAAPVQPVACKTLCELCVNRGYVFCANATKIIPIPTPLPAAPVKEPVARLKGVDEYGPMFDWYKHWVTVPIGTKFYTTPPAAQRPWTGLTDEERQIILDNTHPYNRWTLAERIESKLKEKNT